MSYLDSAEYKNEEIFFKNINTSMDYFDFIKECEAFNLMSEEVDQDDLLDFLITTPHLESFCLLNRNGLSVTAIYHPNAKYQKIFYIVNGWNGLEILREKKT